MIIEFDPVKNQTNFEKHGIELAFAIRIWEDRDLLILPSIRSVDGEERYKAVGRVEGKFYTCVYVLRGQNFRFISVRRSNDAEEKTYHRHSG